MNRAYRRFLDMKRRIIGDLRDELAIKEIDLRQRTTEALRRADRAFIDALEREINELRERIARLETKE